MSLASWEVMSCKGCWKDTCSCPWTWWAPEITRQERGEDLGFGWRHLQWHLDTSVLCSCSSFGIAAFTCSWAAINQNQVDLQGWNYKREITKMRWFLSDFFFKCLCQEADLLFAAWCSTYLKIETCWGAFSQKQGSQKLFFFKIRPRKQKFRY